MSAINESPCPNCGAALEIGLNSGVVICPTCSTSVVFQTITRPPVATKAPESNHLLRFALAASVLGMLLLWASSSAAQTDASDLRRRIARLQRETVEANRLSDKSKQDFLARFPYEPEECVYLIHTYSNFANQAFVDLQKNQSLMETNRILNAEVIRVLRKTIAENKTLKANLKQSFQAQDEALDLAEQFSRELSISQSKLSDQRRSISALETMADSLQNIDRRQRYKY